MASACVYSSRAADQELSQHGTSYCTGSPICEDTEDGDSAHAPALGNTKGA